MTPNPRLVIGTRGSALAVWQAEHVAGLLRQACPGTDFALERIKTTGDKIQDAPLAQVGGKALFVKEIEEALLAGRVHLAVHSMKDVPAEVPAGLALAAILEREDPSDVLISRSGRGLAALPAGARIGTSSLRRRSQLLAHRPDLAVLPLRGNLDTRIRKLSTEGLDAIVVARAGVRRLGLEDRVAEVLPPEVMLPAAGQGALGIEIRVPRAESREPGAENRAESREPRAETNESHARSAGAGVRGVSGAEVAELVRSLDHRATHLAVRAERAVLARLGGSCQVPIAAHAAIEGETLKLRALVAGVEGEGLVRAGAAGPAGDPEGLGQSLAEELLRRGAEEILRRIAGAGR
ncbi:MAG: hydroxymethylbilane synthase [Candidatus Methylomirabilales bacterium]